MRLFFVLSLLLVTAACSDRSATEIVPEAANAPVTQQLYVATNRARTPEGYFGSERADEMSFVENIVSLPANRKPGEPPLLKKRPNPEKHFAIARETDLGSLDGFISTLRRDMSQRPASKREIVLFVHGYYNGHPDTVFRAAQVKNDLKIPGAMINFSWPSAGHPLAYTHDRESALFTRDDLKKLLLRLPETNARKLLLIGHSMGTLLVMETLREIEQTNPGWSRRNLSAVMLISPDLPVDLFARLAEDAEPLPQPFYIITASQDKALRMSSSINRTTLRLGQLQSADPVADLPVRVVDVSAFSDEGARNHFVLGESEALISMLIGIREASKMLNSATTSPATQLRGSVEKSHQASAIHVAQPLTPPDK